MRPTIDLGLPSKSAVISLCRLLTGRHRRQLLRRLYLLLLSRHHRDVAVRGRKEFRLHLLVRLYQEMHWLAENYGGRHWVPLAMVVIFCIKQQVFRNPLSLNYCQIEMVRLC